MPQYMILREEIERIHIRNEGKFVRPADVFNGIVDAYLSTPAEADTVRFSFSGVQIKAEKQSPETVKFEVEKW